MYDAVLIGPVCGNVEKSDLNGSQKLGALVITPPPTSCVMQASHMASHLLCLQVLKISSYGCWLAEHLNL